jgi:hypothetical protein
VVAQRQGQAAARNIIGRHVPFTDVPFFWTQQYDVSVRYVGYARTWDTVEVIGSVDERDCEVRFIGEGSIRAVATVGRDRDCLDAELRLETQGAAAAATHPGAEHAG